MKQYSVYHFMSNTPINFDSNQPGFKSACGIFVELKREAICLKPPAPNCKNCLKVKKL